MSTRSRILLAALVAAVLPLTLLALGARSAVRDRFAQQYHASVEVAASGLRARIDRIGREQAARLAAIAADVQREPRFSAALAGAAERNTLIDFAPAAMEPAGFDFLLLVDDAGTVLSSGHYRNAYGRGADALLGMQAGDSVALVRARRPADTFTALARAHGFAVQGRRYLLVGGAAVDSTFLRSLLPGEATPLRLQLRLPQTSAAAPAGASAVEQRIALPLIDLDENRIVADGAEWIISYSTEPLDALLTSLDRWFGAALGAALLLSFLVARVLAARVNRPLEELARRASRVGLDRTDVSFTTRRRDEVGALARVLDGMVQRLRTGAVQLREAERRATMGDMARQVNHDIRNGLLPIRNVIRHLGEVAGESPGELAEVFAERQQTLHSGIGYLESLATNYARLSPRLERQQCSVNEIIALATQAAAGADRITTDVAPDEPTVNADPVALRRVVENLVVNALESRPGQDARVVVRSARRDGVVAIEVEDDGIGMAPDVVEHILDDFYTTKERGTGLGLSIVRRLVADMGGRVAVSSEPGRGTTFTIELPAA